MMCWSFTAVIFAFSDLDSWSFEGLADFMCYLLVVSSDKDNFVQERAEPMTDS